MDTNVLHGFRRESSAHGSADRAAITFYTVVEFYEVVFSV